ncbi:Deoxyribose-phosphate aldolase [Pseudodesulfovibrio profundus]|uniref:Deoxyribose-phosphate aldolase n=1 Tax=Pseudodesulfovibrio profundus TaxID=57320 RepID=A0A2C8F6F3_9BACT|nr:deoxyribose-phosphate aldolase [Pseudodesulfovibrio profundus]SOB57957.1 Deoxyribose-phosphate aldolase [Pseudodesulfovibrio profundus]
MQLSESELASYIDHTLLKPTATADDIKVLCEEAVRHGFYGVCVNPVRLSLTSWMLKDAQPLSVVVVGFPLGASLSSCKAMETAMAVEQGAREIDMVMNIGALKDGDDSLVVKDIQAVVKAAENIPVKVILETAVLDAEEIVKACQMSVDSGAAFVKTSTGFGPGGATVEAVKLMRKTVGPDIGVKASGGISTRMDAINMIEAGASRIGASASVRIISEK